MKDLNKNIKFFILIVLEIKELQKHIFAYKLWKIITNLKLQLNLVIL